MALHITYAVVVLVIAAAWYCDHRQLDRRLLEAECKLELLDPIRQEAGSEISEKCKCFWSGLSLEQLRRMK